MQTIYSLFSESEVTLPKLIENKLDFIFKPIYDISDISEDEQNKLVKYVVLAFSKDSKLHKVDINFNDVIDGACFYAKIEGDLKSRIVNYEIPELSFVISNYLKMEEPGFRELATAKMLHDEFLTTCTTKVLKSNSEIDYETKSYLFHEALKLKSKIYELEQVGNRDFNEFKKISDNVKVKLSLNSEDLLAH